MYYQKCVDLPPQKNKPLSAKYIRSFAFPSMKERTPIILTKVIDQLARDKDAIVAKYGEDAREDIKTVISKLSKLKNELTTNKPFTEITSDSPDVKIWNNELIKRSFPDGTPPNWFESDWLYAECYFYRRLKEAFEQSTYLQKYDPFLECKIESFVNSKTAILALGQHLNCVLKQINTLSQEEIKKFLVLYLKAALWGNRCDLSLSGGDAVSPDGNILEQTEKLNKYILVDKTQLVWETLTEKTGYKILDIVLDNAGYELFTDLVLADYLISSKLVNKIRFHAKSQPWFVSDVNISDFEYILNAVTNDLNDSVLNDLGKKWRSFLNSGIWSVEAAPFWTYFHDFDAMKETEPELYSRLGEATLVIFKGDLNYRKLMADIHWDPTTSFHDALQSFHPTNVLSLRTVKADLITGLKPGVAENLTNLKSNWLLTGEYATIQFDPSDE